MPTPEQDAEYIGRIAHEAASGMLGFAPPTESDLVDAIVLGLTDIAERAYRRGVDASMVQLSLVHDGAHVVG